MRRDSQKTRSSWWQSVCVHMAGRRATVPSSFGGRGVRGVKAGGEEAGLPAGSGGRLAPLGNMGFRAFCELALRWQLWERMSFVCESPGR